LRVAGNEGDGAEVETVVDDFVGDVAGKHTMETNLNTGVSFAEFGERGEEGVDGAFIDAEGELATLKTLELQETFFDLVAEVEEAIGVFAEELAGVGKADRAGAADEERLAEGVFKFTNGQADSGLRAVETFRGTRKAALAGNSKKNLEFC
jgi:hypothetical protein